MAECAMDAGLDTAANFISQYGITEFEPFAIFDKHLDCIRVRTRDCSILEERKSRFITLLYSAHAEVRTCVGFTLKGIRNLFEKAGLPLTGVIALADVMDAVAKNYPHALVSEVQNEFATIMPLSVELDEPEAA